MISKPDARRSLADRLAAAGIEDGCDPMSAWRRLRAVEGRRATVIDLYELVAGPRGLAPQDLPAAERLELARSTMPFVWPDFNVTEGSERFGDSLEVVDYDPGWPACFERWRELFLDSLGSETRVEHVGSTSVPGLAAKPTVDIQVGIANLTEEELYVGKLEELGFQLRSRDEWHRYFRPFPNLSREVHVHVCQAGSAWEREHILFRDFLRDHPAAAEAYGDVKKAAAREWHDDRFAYTDAKGDFILDILEDAERWASAKGWTVGPR